MVLKNGERSQDLAVARKDWRRPMRSQTVRQQEGSYRGRLKPRICFDVGNDYLRLSERCRAAWTRVGSHRQSFNRIVEARRQAGRRAKAEFSCPPVDQVNAASAVGGRVFNELA